MRNGIQDTPPAATKPASTRDLATVIDNMLAVIPPEETQANASLVMSLLSIRDSASFAPPEGMNIHWRRVLDVIGDTFGDSEPRPGWPTKMCEIFRGGPVRGNGRATSSSPEAQLYNDQVEQERRDQQRRENQERRSLQRMQIEHQTVYAHFILETSLPEHFHEVGHLTIAMLPDEAAFHKASAHNFLYRGFDNTAFNLSCVWPGKAFEDGIGRREAYGPWLHGDDDVIILL